MEEHVCAGAQVIEGYFSGASLSLTEARGSLEAELLSSSQWLAYAVGGGMVGRGYTPQEPGQSWSAF